MNRQFFAAIAAASLILAGCGKLPMENVEVPEEAIEQQDSGIFCEGTLAIKFSDNVTKTVATKASEGLTGIEEVDKILSEAGVTRIERVWSYNPKWEHLYDQTGINRWYAVYYDGSESSASVASKLDGLAPVESISRPVNPKYCKVMRAKAPQLPSVETDPLATKTPPTMNDAYLSYQWHLVYDGWLEKYVETGPSVSDIMSVGEAWNLCTGDPSVIVAVIDEAVYVEHPDLAENIWSNPDNPSEHGRNCYSANTNNLDWRWVEVDGSSYSYCDHGTHVAGSIAAVNNNNIGVCGIAGGDGTPGSGVKIVSCQIFGNPDETAKDSYGEVHAFEYALTSGAVIAQNSWGYVFETPEEAYTFETQWNSNRYTNLRLLKESIETFIALAGSQDPDSPIKGGLVTFSAGNDGDILGDAPCFPSSWDKVIGVTSTGWWSTPSYYTDYGAWADIAAPGGDYSVAQQKNGTSYYSNGEIFSTVNCDPSINFRDGRQSDKKFGYSFMQGTSMACPQVSGVAALGLSYAKKLGKSYTAEEFKSLLLTSVDGIEDKLTGTRPLFDGTMDNSLYAGKMGSGMVNALKLLLAIKGDPIVNVQPQREYTFSLAELVDSYNSSMTLEDVEFSEAAQQKGYSCTVGSRDFVFVPNAEGLYMATLKISVGGTVISRDVALVSRRRAANVGWL